ncbi:MAG: DinB family protein [Acidobacteriaceae bacterium]
MTTPATPAKPEPHLEPWLRGSHSELPAALRAVLHAFELAQEDVHKWTADLSEAELHASPFGLTPIAFHLRHIPGTLDRLLSYAEGFQINHEQLAALKSESQRGGSRKDLFAQFDWGLKSAAQRVRALDGVSLDQPRAVGRKQLPTTIGGLLVHLADHTQRHTGQIVTTSKLLKASHADQAQGGVQGLA